MKPTHMILFSSVLSFGAVLLEAQVPASSQKLNETYVEGLSLLSGIRVELAQARSVAGVVEQGVEAQAASIQSMDMRLSEVRSVADKLGQEAQAQLETGRRLLEGWAAVERQFAALELALNEQDRLLLGATNTIRDLGLAADKSGSHFDRTLAQDSLESLKSLASRLRQLSDLLPQQRLRVTMEGTLLEGLFPKAEVSAKEIVAVSEEAKHLSSELSTQTANLGALRALLASSRARSDKEDQSLRDQLEAFRLVQVQVLRRWLLDGPPAGQVPELSLSSIVEAGLSQDRPMRPSPAQSGFLTPSDVALSTSEMQKYALQSGAGTRANRGSSAQEGTDYSPQALELSKRAEWYLSMLERLIAFGDQSNDRAITWTQASEQWRSGLSSLGSRLAEQKGTLASLEMEQDITTRSLKLLNKQATIAQAEVERLCADMDGKSTRLSKVTQELDKLSTATQ